MRQELREQRQATAPKHHHWGRWGVLGVLVVLGIIGGVQWVQVSNQKKEATTPTTASQTNQLIDQNAKTSAQQRNQQTTSFDRTVGTANPTFTAKLTSELKAKKFSGTALVVKNNQVVYQQSFGWANVAKKQKNAPTTQYLINSLQKSMTGMLVMQAIEQGKLKLTDKLSQYYPKIKNSKTVTIRQMLNMEAGLVGEMKPNTELGERQVYQYAQQHVSVDTSKVGQFDYQPICYVMLAAILNQVNHKSYYNQFYQKIVTPLNLNSTSFVQLRNQTSALSMGYKSTTPSVYTDPQTPAAKDVSSRLGTGNATMSPGNVFQTVRAIVQGSRYKTATNADTLLEKGSTTAKYTGGMYHLDQLGYYGHGVGNFYEDTFIVSTDGKTGVVFMSNDFYKHAMWPTWSTENIAKSTFKSVLAASSLS
ncbi:serine hydrolase domain-containing protein [Levilactobacillus cerevisiae]|uniref:serine hydrolase domain-containing protein n=1 Tax=Levilactobacillus cerevisiae TaxID=1704076 RepID=UPI000F7B39B3|nr:serine hydrolase [Levilactobacillus cerevisiae]